MNDQGPQDVVVRGRLNPIVTSGDDDDNDDDDSSSSSSLSYDTNDTVSNKKHTQAPSHDDLLYDEHADEEDEAYVYQHLRSGRLETIQVQVPTTKTNKRNDNTTTTSSESTAVSQSNTTTTATTKKHSNAASTTTSTTMTTSLQVYQPRTSDAVLSCPCCFTIVCMDCQRHVKYANQYRAMFVMNITIDWNTKYQHATSVSSTRSNNNNNNNNKNHASTLVAVSSDHRGMDDTVQNYYYSVHCAKCSTQVAALDMTDEVYHFFDCLASS